MESADTFEKVAALYHANRTGYVDELFDDLVAIANLKPGVRVLDVGCGSGQATAGYATRGLDVTAIDPGPSLIEIARKQFVGVSNVRFAVSSFEDWALPAEGFNLVASAQAWHWIKPEVRFEKAARALVPGGHLAVFGHTPVWTGALGASLQPIYTRLVPEFTGVPPEVWYLPEGPVTGLFAASGRFKPVQHRHYGWNRRHTRQSFVSYLSTRSDHNMMAEDLRDRLLAEIEAALPDQVVAEFVTNLYVAQLAP